MGEGDEGLEVVNKDEGGEVGRSKSLAGGAGGDIVGVAINKKLGSFCIVVIGSPTSNLV